MVNYIFDTPTCKDWMFAPDTCSEISWIAPMARLAPCSSKSSLKPSTPAIYMYKTHPPTTTNYTEKPVNPYPVLGYSYLHTSISWIVKDTLNLSSCLQ